MRLPCAICLALLLFVGGAIAASAQSDGHDDGGSSKGCIVNPDNPWEGDRTLGACKTCSGDNSTCTECWTGWSLRSDGECVECSASRCFACDPEEPEMCTKCGDWSGESEIGYYATDNGTCAECPTENCMQCSNGDGACTQCTTGMGVVDGVCQPCNDEEACLFCNGDLGVCTECMSGYFLEDGQCKSCPDNCDKCSDGKTCLECNSSGWTLDPDTALCVPCSEGCTYCPKGPNTCDSCDIGYTNMTDGSCAKCTAEHCTSCMPGNPDHCTICATTSSDSWFGGPDENGTECIPCKAKHCAACQDSYRKCDWCEDGYFNDAELEDCTPCVDRWEHCTWCGLDATQSTPGVPACFGCEDGWEPDPNSPDGKCIPAAPSS